MAIANRYAELAIRLPFWTDNSFLRLYTTTFGIRQKFGLARKLRRSSTAPMGLLYTAKTAISSMQTSSSERMESIVWYGTRCGETLISQIPDKSQKKKRTVSFAM
jgi:hypothetical protein